MKHQIPANYREAVDYIEELPKFTEKHPLKHTKKYLEKLQNPAENCKVIHVAGTNGKGSVCAYLQAVLQAEGKKTGFFTYRLTEKRFPMIHFMMYSAKRIM